MYNFRTFDLIKQLEINPYMPLIATSILLLTFIILRVVHRWWILVSVSSKVLGTVWLISILETFLVPRIVFQNFVIEQSTSNRMMTSTRLLGMTLYDLAAVAFGTKKYALAILAAGTFVLLALYSCAKICCFVGSIYPDTTWIKPSGRHKRPVLLVASAIWFIWSASILFLSAFFLKCAVSAIAIGNSLAAGLFLITLLFRHFQKKNNTKRKRIVILRSFNNEHIYKALFRNIEHSFGKQYIVSTIINPLGSNYRHYRTWNLRTSIIRPLRFPYEFFAPADKNWKDIVEHQIATSTAVVLDLSSDSKGLMWEAKRTLELANDLDFVIVTIPRKRQYATYVKSWLHQIKTRTDVYTCIYTNDDERTRKEELRRFVDKTADVVLEKGINLSHCAGIVVSLLFISLVLFFRDLLH